MHAVEARAQPLNCLLGVFNLCLDIGSFIDLELASKLG